MGTVGQGGRGLPVEAVGGAAERAGLRAGDRILAIDGTSPADVLDLEFGLADPPCVVHVARGEDVLEITFVAQRGEAHGITLWNGIGDTVRPCVNACPFCFVDQVPPGLRASLRVKDDDYRLSFLLGDFATLAGLSEADERRILALRLSPLYVSLHAWDDDVRSRLMGPGATGTRETLLRLAAGGICFHLQVVLCPGVNDGSVLDETIRSAAAVDGLISLGVVPVSLAREGRLRRVGPREATAALQTIEAVQQERHDVGMDGFAHGADELYLATGRIPPPCEVAEQYENGVGIVPAFQSDVDETTVSGRARLALLGGTLAAPALEEAARRLARRAAAPHDATPSVRPYVVENRTFGPHVTVTGLLGGRDLLRRLGEEPLAESEWLLAPRCFLPVDPGVTIDDVDEATLRDACGGRFVVADTLAGAVAAVAAAAPAEPPA